MSVWFCIPSKRPAADAARCVAAWRERGYKTILWRDDDDMLADPATVRPDIHFKGNIVYPGYALAVNRMALAVLSMDSSAQWIVTGGDDTFPDPNKTAEEIAAECSTYFKELNTGILHHPFNTGYAYGSTYRETQESSHTNIPLTLSIRSYGNPTFGVMQPTGDRWGDSQESRRIYGDNRGAYIDRICGSPWMGREFCERVNGGKGPLWPEYTHMFVDEELQAVAEKLGVFWQRRDLTHYHEHWGRKPGASHADIPGFLQEVNKPEHWNASKAIFEARLAAGFPGHEPL